MSGIRAYNGGALYTVSPRVNLGLDFYPSAQKMQLYFNGKTWTKPMPFVASKAISLPSGDGQKTVTVRYLDEAGGTLGEYSDTIILDTRVPTGTLKINGGALYTNSSDITLEIIATDVTSGIASVCIKENRLPCSDAEFMPYVVPSMAGQPGGDGRNLPAAGRYSYRTARG